MAFTKVSTIPVKKSRLEKCMRTWITIKPHRDLGLVNLLRRHHKDVLWNLAVYKLLWASSLRRILIYNLKSPSVQQGAIYVTVRCLSQAILSFTCATGQRNRVIQCVEFRCFNPYDAVQNEALLSGPPFTSSVKRPAPPKAAPRRLTRRTPARSPGLGAIGHRLGIPSPKSWPISPSVYSIPLAEGPHAIAAR